MHANERLQLSVMMERLTGLVLPEDMIDREIQWVDERMGTGGWVDRVARGRELILQPLQEVPSPVRMAIPLCVGWASQVFQQDEDRLQGGLSDPEQLLLTNLNDALGLNLDDYAREWRALFRY